MNQPVAIGEVLAGKYRIDRVLGEGGMGVVVAATHVSLEQRVAIKFLLPAALNNAEVVARFAREARAAAKIRGEHVARVIDVGELPGGAPFMVMEYLEGEDLAQALERRGPLPIEESCDYILQACEALAEAHAAGIVHRDIKPANLFAARTPDHSVILKVLDFGISKSMDQASASLTRTSAVLGSAFYLSPEQLTAARHVDARADVWALGVVLYQLLTNRVPFDGESMPEVVAGILRNMPTPVAEIRRDVSPQLAQAIHDCLRTDPAHRLPTVLALARAIGPFAPRRAAVSVDRIARVLGGGPIVTQPPGPSPLASSMVSATPIVATPLPPGTPLPMGPAHGLGGPLAVSSAANVGAMAATPAPARSPHERTNMHWASSDAGLAEAPKKGGAGLFIGLGALAFLGVVGLVVTLVVVPFLRNREHVAPDSSASAAADTSPSTAPSSLATAIPSANVADADAGAAPSASVAVTPPASASAASSSAHGSAAQGSSSQGSTSHTGSSTHHASPTTHAASARPGNNAFSNMGLQ